MKSVYSFLLSGILFVAMLSAQALADSIGYVDVDSIYGGYSRAQSIAADAKVREADLQKVGAEYAKQIEESRKINAKNPVATETLAKQLREKYAARVNESRDWFTAQKKDIDVKIQNAIQTIAKKRSVDVVVSQAAVLSGGTDLTSDVITTLNKQP